MCAEKIPYKVRKAWSLIGLQSDPIKELSESVFEEFKSRYNERMETAIKDESFQSVEIAKALVNARTNILEWIESPPHSMDQLSVTVDPPNPE